MKKKEKKERKIASDKQLCRLGFNWKSYKTREYSYEIQQKDLNSFRKREVVPNMLSIQ